MVKRKTRTVWYRYNLCLRFNSTSICRRSFISGDFGLRASSTSVKKRLKFHDYETHSEKPKGSPAVGARFFEEACANSCCSVLPSSG